MSFIFNAIRTTNQLHLCKFAMTCCKRLLTYEKNLELLQQVEPAADLPEATAGGRHSPPHAATGCPTSWLKNLRSLLNINKNIGNDR